MAKHGENIRKRKDGRWEGRYIKSRTTEGKALWGYVYGSTYAKVKQVLIQKKAECGFYQLSGKNPIFEELAIQWLTSISVSLKESTLSHYDYTLNRYILPIFGRLQIKSLDEQTLEQGMLQVISPADHRHRPLGTSSARECLTILRRICKYAAHLRLIRPMEICVCLPQSKNNKIQPLSKEEQASVETFVRKSPTARKVGLLLTMQLGLRIGEVCGLQWGDFDLKAGTLTVQRTVSRISTRDGHTKVVIQSPKTKSSRRKIPIPRNLVQILKSLKGDAEPEVWFLSGNAEKPVEPRCYRKSIQIYLRQAAVRKVRPHTLRHTFATTCLQAGCDIKTLSEILGHANANITLQRYVHSDIERKRKEINRIFCPGSRRRQGSMSGCAAR